jgi:hypothetical protein
VKVFLAACLAAIVLAAISWVVLSVVQEPADRAFATPPIRGSAIRQADLFRGGAGPAIGGQAAHQG